LKKENSPNHLEQKSRDSHTDEIAFYADFVQKSNSLLFTSLPISLSLSPLCVGFGRMRV